MKERPVPAYLSLPESLYQRIDQLARENGRSKCKYIRQIIRRYLRYLDRREDPDAPPVQWEIESLQVLLNPSEPGGA